MLGSSDVQMAYYWNSHFPSLLPVTYCLARVYLVEVDQFRRFVPAPMSADVAQGFIQAYCRPAAPAMWARVSVNVRLLLSSPINY